MEDIVDYHESEAYLEAKQYIERIKQESERTLESEISLESKRRIESESIAVKGLDVSDHGLSLTVFPVSGPCVPLSYATVQWDTLETPADPPSPRSDRDSIDGPAFDWTLNLPSVDVSYIPDQDVDLPPEAIRSTSSQTCDAQKTQTPPTHDESSTTFADIKDSRADGTEEHFGLSDGAQILMDTSDSQMQPESSESQEEEEEVLPKMTFSHEESTDSGSEKQTPEWTETEAHVESADARTAIQDQTQEPTVVENESPEVQSDPSQDLTNGSVDLEEAILTQELDQKSTSVTAAEINQDNDRT
ncbi:submandibular gland secretory Glx-rich protein CB-like [Pseudorasbora parva]|uniref:submandibular gland secretory Glx-rich protein CB-like n=1 Tax=Pseudorasbora parva TaxID=51549 RepID=UPI00351DD64B